MRTLVHSCKRVADRNCKGYIQCLDNNYKWLVMNALIDPPAGSPTGTLLRLLLPLVVFVLR